MKDLAHLSFVDLLKLIRSELERHEDVALAYLFGSAARHSLTPLSDIDVGVVFDGQVSAEVSHGQLMDALCRRLGTDKVDLIPLHQAPPALQYRVVRDGRLLICRDQALRQRFEANSVLRYLDIKPLRDNAFRTGTARILGQDNAGKAAGNRPAMDPPADQGPPARYEQGDA